MPDDTERKDNVDETEPSADESVGRFSIDRARSILGKLVNRAGFGNERIAITRNGEPTAYVIGPADMQRLVALEAAQEPATESPAAA